MATKANFTPDEWKVILGSPMLAGVGGYACRTKRYLGTDEGRHGERYRGAAMQRLDAGANRTAKALVAEMETSEGRSIAQDGLKSELTGKSPAELKQQVIAILVRVGQILIESSG